MNLNSYLFIFVLVLLLHTRNVFRKMQLHYLAIPCSTILNTEHFVRF